MLGVRVHRWAASIAISRILEKSRLTNDKGGFLALDCISEGDSTKISSAAVSSSGGKIASLLPLKDQKLRSDVEYSVS